MIIDSLIEKIDQLKNPTAVGLDTFVDYLPEHMQSKCGTAEDCAKYVTEFNYKIIDRIADIVPAVKVQVAYYEIYGHYGMKAFADTLAYAKSKGLYTIADAKRNDIGSTAAAYAKAFLSGVQIGGKKFCGFEADFLTVNGYLGSDGILPFIDAAKQNDKGIFVLVKTSNPASGELQDKVYNDGDTLYEKMGTLLTEWGKPLVGEYGYSGAGAVVGATHPQQAADIRKKFPNMFFLIPGYGAQGGKASDLAVSFDEKGRGGIVNNSRGILCAYKKEKYSNMTFDAAAYAACCDMQADISAAIYR